MLLMSIHSNALRAHVGRVITAVELGHVTFVYTTMYGTGHRQGDRDFNMTSKYGHGRMSL